jgi:hypothetical protein
MIRLRVLNRIGFLSFLLQNRYRIDGGSWEKGHMTRATEIQATPGEHTIEVALVYLFLIRYAKASMTVSVTEGQTVEVRYTAPWFVFQKGKIEQV